MRRIRLVIEYEGTRYAGWQVQKNGLAVQAALEAELFKITGESITVYGSGRTDSGVHALAQTAHFDTGARMRADKFAFALNAGLPSDIRVRYSDEVGMDFHARYSALRKHYRYTLQAGAHSRVFTRRTALHVHGRLDIPLMRNAAADLMGAHDFAAFMSTGSRVDCTVREIYRSEWSEGNGLLYYDIEGNGFLYNMVRIIAGTLLSIGKGLLPPDSIQRALQSKKRVDAGPTAPAHALMLMGVHYADFHTDSLV